MLWLRKKVGFLSLLLIWLRKEVGFFLALLLTSGHICLNGDEDEYYTLSAQDYSFLTYKAFDINDVIAKMTAFLKHNDPEAYQLWRSEEW